MLAEACPSTLLAPSADPTVLADGLSSTLLAPSALSPVYTLGDDLLLGSGLRGGGLLLGSGLRGGAGSRHVSLSDLFLRLSSIVSKLGTANSRAN